MKALLLLLAFLVGCSSKPVEMKSNDVKVSRDIPAKDCKLIGNVKGTVQGLKPNLELAIEDMKKEAADKGANYVQMESQSSYGTAVAGEAYDCP
jgi:uncharacterized protein YbjQ (UPF0145 family)